ncbi:MAG: ATP-binding protein [Bacillota bacterium]|nr:ATP-binding protein [Bacillota bacterium]
MRLIHAIRSSLLKKTILVIMAVVLLPLSIWTFLYFDALSRNHYNNKIRSVQNAMSQTIISMDNVMELCVKFGWVLADDSKINDLVKYQQIDQTIITQTMYHIKPLLNIIMYQNDYIKSIRIVHNNQTLFNIYDLLYREEKLADRISRIHQLTPEMRFPKTAIEYCQEGHLYPFTDNFQADRDIWYIYTIIDTTSLNQYVGFIEVVVDHLRFCQPIANMPKEPGESVLLIDRGGTVLFSSGAAADLGHEALQLTGDGIHTLSQDHTRMTAISYELKNIEASLVYLIPQANLSLAEDQWVFMFFAILIMICSLFVLSILLSRLVLKKLLAFSSHIEQINHTQADHIYPIRSHDELGILINTFNQMIMRLHAAFERERELLYAQLTNQLKPHFICNAMDMLRIKAEKAGQNPIATAAMQIGKFFRYSMVPAKITVSLRDELNDTINYIQLVNQLRESPIEHSLSMDAWIEQHLADVQVPKLILQPIVENAVRHGLVKRAIGYISIDLKRSEDILVIQVEDNGIGMNEEQLAAVRQNLQTDNNDENSSVHGLGLANVIKRLDFQFPGRSTFDIQSQPSVGTRVIIRIQIS